MWQRRLLCSFLFVLSIECGLSKISLSSKDLKIKLDESEVVKLKVSDQTAYGETLQFDVQHDDIVGIEPQKITLDQSEYDLKILAKGAGHSEISSNITDPAVNVNDVYLRVTVYKNLGLDTFTVVIGWIYFAAWSVSFYPQMYQNFRRKSVVGLNFDFVYLNVVGFALYSLFNIGLYCIPVIEDEYADRNPRGLNPVQVNDIVFAVHATAACLLTIVQLQLYERGDQRVSLTARAILGVFGLVLLVTVILGATEVLHWLDFLYICSYLKLTLTLIKYIPQAYMNYKRKSTVGWSIGNIFLDFTGGMLSMLQMILNAYNYDDWVSIFGDPTKFGLGLFSVVFDIFFIIQHYILYRHTNYQES